MRCCMHLPACHAIISAYGVADACWCRFTAAIEAINERLEQYAGGRKQVSYLDCSQSFIEDNPKVSCLKSVLHQP